MNFFQFCVSVREAEGARLEYSPSGNFQVESSQDSNFNVFSI